MHLIPSTSARPSRRLRTLALLTIVALAATVSAGCRPQRPIALTTVGGAASTTPQLYPGGDGDLKIHIKNDNAYPVRVTNINTGAGSITSNKGAACNASTGATFVNTAGSWDVSANNTASFTLAGKVRMSNISDSTCQGAVFTVPVALSGVEVKR